MDKYEEITTKNKIKALEIENKNLKEEIADVKSVLKSEKSMNDTLKECNIRAFTQVHDLAKQNEELYLRNSKLKHAYNVLLERYETQDN